MTVTLYTGLIQATRRMLSACYFVPPHHLEGIHSHPKATQCQNERMCAPCPTDSLDLRDCSSSVQSHNLQQNLSSIGIAFHVLVRRLRVFQWVLGVNDWLVRAGLEVRQGVLPERIGEGGFVL